MKARRAASPERQFWDAANRDVPLEPGVPGELPPEKPQTPCPEHPDLPAAGTCVRCGRFVCVRCVPDVSMTTKVRCPACLAREQEAVPTGIGGWLVLPALNVVAQPLLAFAFAAFLFWAENARRSPYDGVLGLPVERASLVPAAVFLVLYGVFGAVVAVFFFGRRKAAPSLYIAMVLINVGVAVMGTSSAANDSDAVIRAAIGAAIWIPYFLLSKRVKATFVR